MKLTDFTPDVRQEIPEAPPPLVLTQTRKVLRKFCRESLAWRERIESTAIRVGRVNYDLSSLGDGIVCSILDMQTKNTRQAITHRTEQQLTQTYATWRLQTGATPLHYLTPVEPSQIVIYPIPEVAGDYLSVNIAMHPRLNATEIPDWFGDLYFEQLVAGIVGALQRLPKKSWSDLKAANENDSLLGHAIHRAATRISKQHGTGPTFARMTGFESL